MHNIVIQRNIKLLLFTLLIMKTTRIDPYCVQMDDDIKIHSKLDSISDKSVENRKNNLIPISN